MPLYDAYRASLGPDLQPLLASLDAEPQNPRWHFELGLWAQHANHAQLAYECFLRVSQLAPHVGAGFFNLGNACFEIQEYAQAIEAYQRALQMQPDSSTLVNLGNSYAALGDWDPSIAAYDRALEFPNIPLDETRLTFRNRGKALMATGDLESAIDNYQRACAQFPTEIEFLGMQAQCHQRGFGFGAAMECLIQSIERSPNHPGVLCQIADVNFARGHLTESLLCLERAFSIQPPSAHFHSQWLRMLTHCPAVSPERLLAEAERWASCHTLSLPRITPAFETIDPTPIAEPKARPLQVGVLCNDPLLAGSQHWLAVLTDTVPKDQIEWSIYWDRSTTHHDDVERWSQAINRFESIEHLDDRALAERIASHQLDVWIDMVGHGHRSRLRAFAMRPCSYQVSWNSFPCTSGLDAMDTLWTDRMTLGIEAEHQVSERVMRFPSTSYCFVQPEAVPIERTEGMNFRCGIVASPETLSEPFLDTLCQVMQCVPDAELIFVGVPYQDTSLQNDLRTQLAVTDEDRVRIRFVTDHDENHWFRIYDALDMVLDPFPVGSVSKALESLWMGVPVITKVEERFAGRGVASILHCLKRSDWIAATSTEYTTTVERMSNQRVPVRNGRESLRAELLDSPICNMLQKGREIHALILEWTRTPLVATQST